MNEVTAEKKLFLEHCAGWRTGRGQALGARGPIEALKAAPSGCFPGC
ncbi:MAG: hypothetical protein ACXWUD_11830 [Methylosarcina sp.]